jgi:hypothetical protein
MQSCQRLEADCGMDPQIWQSLDGPSFHLSSKLSQNVVISHYCYVSLAEPWQFIIP